MAARNLADDAASTTTDEDRGTEGVAREVVQASENGRGEQRRESFRNR